MHNNLYRGEQNATERLDFFYNIFIYDKYVSNSLKKTLYLFKEKR